MLAIIASPRYAMVILNCHIAGSYKLQCLRYLASSERQVPYVRNFTKHSTMGRNIFRLRKLANNSEHLLHNCYAWVAPFGRWNECSFHFILCEKYFRKRKRERFSKRKRRLKICLERVDIFGLENKAIESRTGSSGDKASSLRFPRLRDPARECVSLCTHRSLRRKSRIGGR